MKPIDLNLKRIYNLPINIKYIEPYKFSYNLILKMKTPIRSTNKIEYMDINNEIHSQR